MRDDVGPVDVQRVEKVLQEVGPGGDRCVTVHRPLGTAGSRQVDGRRHGRQCSGAADPPPPYQVDQSSR